MDVFSGLVLDGKIKGEGINCAARDQENCNFDVTEVKKVIEITTSDGENLVFKEGENIYRREHLVIPNVVLEVTRISNSSSSDPSDDEVSFKNDVTGEESTFRAHIEGEVIVSFEGKNYIVKYHGASTDSNPYINFNFPQSEGNAMNLEMCF